MADSDPKDLTAILTSRGQAPVIAMVLILATTLGVLNLSPRPGANPPTQGAAANAGTGAATAATTTTTTSGPPPKASTVDALEALEPLQRFLNLSTPPSSLEQLASGLAG